MENMEPVDELKSVPAGEVEPDTLLREFRDYSDALDNRLDALLETIQTIRSELQNSAQNNLVRLAQAAQDMINGRVYQQIDLEAKGEVGTLVTSLNQTMANLQQLDASVKQQSTQVPELAAQLDAITADTETATQEVMNRLDTLMAAADNASRSFREATRALEQTQAAQQHFQTQIDGFLERASQGENPTVVAQEVLDFLFEHQTTTKLPPVDLEAGLAHLQSVSDESFEILNTLQFQDITRQKVEKVVLLLKQFREGLNRLLVIFKITEAEPGQSGEIFEHRVVATQEKIFDTSLEADGKKESVDDIIAQFKKAQG
nr:methyl-accepting chemotaxis protein [uncultured Holophaga sp.]